MYYNNITIQKIIILVYICSIGTIYTLLPDYNPYRMDDGWFASFIYQSHIRGISTDEVFGGDLSNGFGDTQLFGKAYTTLYGSMAFIFQRWDKQFFYLLSSILVFATAMLWWQIAKRLGMPTWASVIFSLSLLYIDVFFSTFLKSFEAFGQTVTIYQIDKR